MKVYVAGPMRGIPAFNFPAFDDAAEHLLGLGHEVVNPADRDRKAHGHDFAEGNTAGDEGAASADFGFNLREALAWDLDKIARHCDAVAVLDGWEKSKGARAEVALARALGLPVAPVQEFEQDGTIASPLTDWELDAIPGHFGNTNGYAMQFPYDIPSRVKILDAPVGAYSFWGVKDLDDWQRPISPPAHWVDATTWGDGEKRVDINVDTGETRSTSSTGGAKGVKLARFDLLPAHPLRVLAEHYGLGADKYDDHNWRKGYEWSKSFAAMQRHAWAFWAGEDNDPENGSPHLAAVAFHAFAMLQGAVDHPEFDDRYKGEES